MLYKSKKKKIIKIIKQEKYIKNRKNVFKSKKKK